MGVNNAERAGLEGIARAGKGHYYGARDAREIAAALEKALPVGKLDVNTPAIVNRASGASGVIVSPLKVQGFPPITKATLTKAGKRFDTVQSTKQLGAAMLVPAGAITSLEAGDGNWNAIRVVENLEVPPGQVAVVQSRNFVSAEILVKDPGLGGSIESVTITLAGKRFSDVQMVKNGVGKPLLVPAGKDYDVYIQPKGGDNVAIAQNVRPGAGEMLVIGGNGGDDAPAKEAMGLSPAAVVGEEQEPVAKVDDAGDARPQRGFQPGGRNATNGSLGRHALDRFPEEADGHAAPGGHDATSRLDAADGPDAADRPVRPVRGRHKRRHILAISPFHLAFHPQDFQSLYPQPRREPCRNGITREPARRSARSVG